MGMNVVEKTMLLLVVVVVVGPISGSLPVGVRSGAQTGRGGGQEGIARLGGAGGSKELEEGQR